MLGGEKPPHFAVIGTLDGELQGELLTSLAVSEQLLQQSDIFKKK